MSPSLFLYLFEWRHNGLLRGTFVTIMVVFLLVFISYYNCFMTNGYFYSFLISFCFSTRNFNPFSFMSVCLSIIKQYRKTWYSQLIILKKILFQRAYSIWLTLSVGLSIRLHQTRKNIYILTAWCIFNKEGFLFFKKFCAIFL